MYTFYQMKASVLRNDRFTPCIFFYNILPLCTSYVLLLKSTKINCSYCLSVRSPVFRFVILLGISRPDVKRFLVLLLFNKYFSFSCPTVRSPLRLFATVGILKLLFKGFFSKLEIVPFLGFSSFHLLILNFF